MLSKGEKALYKQRNIEMERLGNKEIENPAQGVADFARANGLDKIADAISPKVDIEIPPNTLKDGEPYKLQPKGKEIDTWKNGDTFSIPIDVDIDLSDQPKETDELALIIDRQLSSLYCMIDRDHNIAQPEAEYDQALSAIQDLIRREVVKELRRYVQFNRQQIRSGDIFANMEARIQELSK